MSRIRALNATLVATLLALSLVAAVTLLGVGLVGANHPDDAPDMTDEADFKANFPAASDHHPGSMNPQGGSIQYFASGADAFGAQGAEEGVYIDWIIVHAEYEGEDWIDYSACSTSNTEAFGIDRGNNNEGTQYDEDLVQKQETVEFRDDGIVIDFYEFEDFSNDPPYMAPEDAIVAAQGEGSAGGPCLTLTDQPGWYRIAAFMNGTVADNGQGEQPSDSAGEVSLELNSNFLYVCDCENEDEAREKLGPPPDEQDGQSTPTDSGGDDGEATPEPTAAQSDDGTDGNDGGSGGETTPEPTAAQNDGGGGGDGGDGGDDGNDGGSDASNDGGNDGGDTGDASGSGSGNDAGGSGAAATREPGGQGSGNLTPTPGDGPGFTGVAALIALLAAALLAYRRD